MKHIQIDTNRLLAAVQESHFGMSNPGFCLACGDDADGVEPDARNYPCHSCGKKQVFGAEEVLLMQQG